MMILQFILYLESLNVHEKQLQLIQLLDGTNPAEWKL